MDGGKQNLFVQIRRGQYLTQDEGVGALCTAGHIVAGVRDEHRFVRAAQCHLQGLVRLRRRAGVMELMPFAPHKSGQLISFLLCIGAVCP